MLQWHWGLQLVAVQLLQILQLLQDTCRHKGVTVVVITHNSALTPMADRVIRIKNGTVAEMVTNNTPTPVENIEW